MSEEWAELGEAISAIRIGIEQALADGASSAVRFELGPVELELTATVRKDAQGYGKTRSDLGERYQADYPVRPSRVGGGGQQDPATVPHEAQWAGPAGV